MSFYIVSQKFQNIMVRFAGEANPRPKAAGFGTVNCQASASAPDGNPWEQVNIVDNSDGTFSFESAYWRSNYLRMEGPTIPTFQDSGFGTVNLQGSIGPWEKFKIHFLGVDAEKGTLVAIESAAWPGCYLRLDSQGGTSFQDSGFGMVNCQAAIKPWERFYLTPNRP